MSKKVAKAGLIGAVIGAIAGVFVLAPKGAKDNRQAAKDLAKKGAVATEKKLKAAYAEVQVGIDKLKAKSQTVSGKAKEQLDARRGQAEVLLGELKQLITSVREGENEVNDHVKKALGEAKKLKDSVVKQTKGAVGAAKSTKKS